MTDKQAKDKVLSGYRATVVVIPSTINALTGEVNIPVCVEMKVQDMVNSAPLPLIGDLDFNWSWYRSPNEKWLRQFRSEMKRLRDMKKSMEIQFKRETSQLRKLMRQANKVNDRPAS